MKKLALTIVLAIGVLASCQASPSEHVHVPDKADCQHAQLCTACGEVLAEHGEHDYPEAPQTEGEGYSFYECRVCGKIKIVNQDGAPVVPVE